MEELLTPKETAVYLKLSYNQVLVLIKQDKIPYIKFGGRYRISITQLNKMITKAAGNLE